MNFAIHKLDKTEEFIEKLLEIHTRKELKKLALKNTYICPYCQESLRVNSGEERSYFTHPKNKACIESRQVEKSFSQYKKQIKRESLRHSILVSIVKDELETAAIGRKHIEIVEGYRVERFEKHFPDLYVCNGSREWAITVLTDLTESESIAYAKNFRERHEYFLDKGLEPLWLIDKANFATEKNKRSLVMWEIEWLSSVESKEDIQWEESIKQYTDRYELLKVLDYPTLDFDKELQVRSIYYISKLEEKNVIRVFRYIDDLANGSYRGFLIGETSTISFSQALHIENEAFQLSDPKKELQMKQELKEEFMKFQEEIKARRKKIEEEELKRKQLLATERELKEINDQQKRLEEAKAPKSQTPYLLKKNDQASYQLNWNSFSATSYEEQELDRYWHEQFKEMRKKRPQKLTSIIQVSEKRYEEFKERLLSVRIEGEIYIQSPNRKWRKLILDWLEENYYEEKWNVSTQMMLELLKDSQIEFTKNNEKILKSPIKGFLVAFNIFAKRDLKIRNVVEIGE